MGWRCISKQSAILIAQGSDHSDLNNQKRKRTDSDTENRRTASEGRAGEVLGEEGEGIKQANS